jgi:hypothetical protein
VVAPQIEKFACPEWGYVLPEELKILIEQVTADSLQIAAQKIVEFDLLLRCQILRSFQKAPVGMGKDGIQSTRIEHNEKRSHPPTVSS